MAQTVLTIAALLVFVITTAIRIPQALTRFVNSLRPLVRAAFALKNEIARARADLDQDPGNAS